MPLYNYPKFNKFTIDHLGYYQYFTIINSTLINFFESLSPWIFPIISLISPKWNCGSKKIHFFSHMKIVFFLIAKTVYILENSNNINNYEEKSKNFQISNHQRQPLFVFW